jgi:hypothetical protein
VSAVGAIALSLVSRAFTSTESTSRSDGVGGPVGLGLGICILIMALLLGLFALFLCGLPDNGF